MRGGALRTLIIIINLIISLFTNAIVEGVSSTIGRSTIFTYRYTQSIPKFTIRKSYYILYAISINIVHVQRLGILVIPAFIFTEIIPLGVVMEVEILVWYGEWDRNSCLMETGKICYTVVIYIFYHYWTVKLKIITHYISKKSISVRGLESTIGIL